MWTPTIFVQAFSRPLHDTTMVTNQILVNSACLSINKTCCSVSGLVCENSRLTSGGFRPPWIHPVWLRQRGRQSLRKQPTYNIEDAQNVRKITLSGVPRKTPQSQALNWNWETLIRSSRRTPLCACLEITRITRLGTWKFDKSDNHVP